MEENEMIFDFKSPSGMKIEVKSKLHFSSYILFGFYICLAIVSISHSEGWKLTLWILFWVFACFGNIFTLFTLSNSFYNRLKSTLT
jgi:hypothetical protein